MQKKVIALAVAGLVSGAAFAQSNVTIYGVADAAFVQSSGDTPGTGNANTSRGSKNYTGIQSGGLAGSRIGFKGEEGLGNGLKAVFTLEYQLDIDNNSGIGSGNSTGLNSRQSFVGLEHNKLGTLSAGRQYAPGFYATAKADPFGASTTIGTLATLQGTGYNTIHGSSNARWSNSLNYTSPVWSGFQVRAAYAFGEATEPTTANNAGGGVGQGANGRFGAGLNYANGPLNVDLVYQTRQDQVTALHTAATSVAALGGKRISNGSTVASRGTGDSVNEWFLGGSYDFGVAKVFGSYQDMNDNNGTSANEASNSVWNVGVSVPVFGNGKVLASYGHQSWDRTGAGDTTAWALGYTHSLSKRTTLYTGYTHFNNDRTVVNAAGIVAATKNVGESNGTFAAGLNHSF